MSSDGQGPDESRGGLARGFVMIVAVGIALGVTFNAIQLASGPRRGLAWIKQEVKLASLESVDGTAEAAAAPTEGAPPAPEASAEPSSEG